MKLARSEEALDCSFCGQPAGSICIHVRGKQVGTATALPHHARVEKWVRTVVPNCRSEQARQP